MKTLLSAALAACAVPISGSLAAPNVLVVAPDKKARTLAKVLTELPD